MVSNKKTVILQIKKNTPIHQIITRLFDLKQANLVQARISIVNN